MQALPIHAAYDKRNAVLWVTPADIQGALHRMKYGRAIQYELGEWIARKMSMAFVAGQRGTAAPADGRADVVRMLTKMGYLPEYVAEISDYIAGLLPALYAKGQSRATLRAR